jgi:hypothetical protein
MSRSRCASVPLARGSVFILGRRVVVVGNDDDAMSTDLWLLLLLCHAHKHTRAHTLHSEQSVRVRVVFFRAKRVCNAPLTGFF